MVACPTHGHPSFATDNGKSTANHRASLATEGHTRAHLPGMPPPQHLVHHARHHEHGHRQARLWGGLLVEADLRPLGPLELGELRAASPMFYTWHLAFVAAFQRSWASSACPSSARDSVLTLTVQRSVN